MDEVRLSDLETSFYVPPGKDIVRGQLGNQWWRSPEAHTKGPMNKYSDIFSFGIVVSRRMPKIGEPRVWMIANTVEQCLYAVTKHVIFYVDEKTLSKGKVALVHILERQISWFATNWESYEGFLKHLGDNPWCPMLEGHQ